MTGVSFTVHGVALRCELSGRRALVRRKHARHGHRDAREPLARARDVQRGVEQRPHGHGGRAGRARAPPARKGPRRDEGALQVDVKVGGGHGVRSGGGNGSDGGDGDARLLGAAGRGVTRRPPPPAALAHLPLLPLY